MKPYQTSIIMKTKSPYIRRLIPPAVYLILLAVLWLATPVSELLFPAHAASADDLEKLHKDKFTCISTTLTGLHFTGYTQTLLGHTNGYYYYTFHNNDCILLLLEPDTCNGGMPVIEEITVKVRIIADFEDYDILTSSLASDLDWTVAGIRSRIPDYLLSEPDFNSMASVLLLGFFFFSGAWAAGSILICISCILFPAISPPCRKH